MNPVVSLLDKDLASRESIGDLPVIYLNRLSDLLFVLARWSNKLGGIEETKWEAE